MDVLPVKIKTHNSNIKICRDAYNLIHRVYYKVMRTNLDARTWFEPIPHKERMESIVVENWGEQLTVNIVLFTLVLNLGNNWANQIKARIN